MKKDSNILVLKGTIVVVKPRGEYIVRLKNNHELKCYVSGKMRMNYIKLMQNDKVVIEVPKYDLKIGRIVYRENPRKNHNVFPK